MSMDPAFTRRLLLGHGFGAALLLPGALRAEAVPHRGGLTTRTNPTPLVVLDPGHGGKDPGAIGVSGTYEKHVALATAQRLAGQLRAAGYGVHLTREADDFIPLDGRVEIAQSQGAALFMSIHADAIADHNIRGASVYTLAGKASDAQTAMLAEHENAADRYGLPGVDATRQVSEILASLVRHETRVGSARMQGSVVANLGREVPLLENPARHAAFAVLKSADIPSVLVEMGFMSNHHDEAELRQVEHQEKVASALRRSVDAYFAANGHLTHIAG